jgi:PAS domain S-box-containing protein
MVLVTEFMLDGKALMAEQASFSKLYGETVSGREVAHTDWSKSSLGKLESWSQPLKTLVAALLACPTPMFLAWGPDRLSFFNDAYRPILGQRVKGAMGRPFEQLWHDIWSDIEPLVHETYSGGNVEMIDMRLDIHRDGVPEESWWTFSYSPVWDDSNVVAGLLCITRETTEKVRAEQDRKKAAARLQAALSIGDPIGSWEWDVVNDRVTADQQFAVIYNVDPARAAAGTPLSEFLHCIHPDDLPLVQSQINNAVRYGDHYQSEYRIFDRVGEIHWISAQGRAVLDATGSCIRFPGVCFDITINKKIEAEREGTGSRPR